MTSRLKHKLELENVNLKSAYLNESFVQVSLTADGQSSRTKTDRYRSVRPCLHWPRPERTSSSMCQNGSKR